jgi:hypothetical protein
MRDQSPVRSYKDRDLKLLWGLAAACCSSPMRFNELRETLQLRLSGEFKWFADEELRAVLTLLAGPGVVWELAFGSWVLLQPERINAYAQAVFRTLRADARLVGTKLKLPGDGVAKAEPEETTRLSPHRARCFANGLFLLPTQQCL